MIDIKDYNEIIVCDIEATCCDDNSIPRDEREIIEIGLALYEVDENKFNLLDTYKSFVIPVRHKILTRYCTNLTGITQDDITVEGRDFKRVFDCIDAWVNYDTIDNTGLIWGSWGAFDYYMLRGSCEYYKIKNPFENIKHLNLKNELKDSLGMKKGLGMKRALAKFDLTFEGEQHRALYDALNTGRLLPYIYGEK